MKFEPYRIEPFELPRLSASLQNPEMIMENDLNLLSPIEKSVLASKLLMNGLIPKARHASSGSNSENKSEGIESSSASDSSNSSMKEVDEDEFDVMLS
jgi:hypothetical protein